MANEFIDITLSGEEQIFPEFPNPFGANIENPPLNSTSIFAAGAKEEFPLAKRFGTIEHTVKSGT